MSPRRPACPHGQRPVALVPALLVLALLGACSDDRVNRAEGGQLTTTTVSVFDPALPQAVDLGAGYEEVSASSALSGPCSFAISEPTRRAARSFVSNAAQERIDLQVLHYRDEQSASGAFSGAQAASSCRPSQFGEAGGRPRLVEIEGARASFEIGFTDQVDSVGMAVAVVGGAVVVVQSALHHGASSAEPLGARETAARAIARLR